MDFFYGLSVSRESEYHEQILLFFQDFYTHRLFTFLEQRRHRESGLIDNSSKDHKNIFENDCD